LTLISTPVDGEDIDTVGKWVKVPAGFEGKSDSIISIITGDGLGSFVTLACNTGNKDYIWGFTSKSAQMAVNPQYGGIYYKTERSPYWPLSTINLNATSASLPAYHSPLEFYTFATAVARPGNIVSIRMGAADFDFSTFGFDGALRWLELRCGFRLGEARKSR
jgi:hypothetical protein